MLQQPTGSGYFISCRRVALAADNSAAGAHIGVAGNINRVTNSIEGRSVTVLAELSIVISHSQLSVFDRSLERPFNDWADRHIAQGFSWRPGSVAFGTIEEGGRHIVTVNVRNDVGEPAADAIRVIDVPFEVPETGAVEVASISDSVPLKLPPGIYQLRFECLGRANSPHPRIRLSFRPDDKPQFKIVRADSELRPSANLLLTASPA